MSVHWSNLNHDITSPSVGVKRSDLWFLFWLKWKEIHPYKAGLGSLINQSHTLGFDWMTNQNLIHGGETLPADVDQHIWLADQSKSSKGIQNDLWLVSQFRISVPRESSIKINVFRVRGEKRSDVYTKDKRIRNEISPRTKVSPVKASFSKKVNKREKLHQTNISIVCLSNTTKKTISIYIYILYILLSHHCVSINNC